MCLKNRTDLVFSDRGQAVVTWTLTEQRTEIQINKTNHRPLLLLDARRNEFFREQLRNSNSRSSTPFACFMLSKRLSTSDGSKQLLGSHPSRPPSQEIGGQTLASSFATWFNDDSFIEVTPRNPLAENFPSKRELVPLTRRTNYEQDNGIDSPQSKEAFFPPLLKEEEKAFHEEEYGEAKESLSLHLLSDPESSKSGQGFQFDNSLSNSLTLSHSAIGGEQESFNSSFNQSWLLPPSKVGEQAPQHSAVSHYQSAPDPPPCGRGKRLCGENGL